MTELPPRDEIRSLLPWWGKLAQRMLRAEAVAHGQAGAVLALEVSRLARSSTDWQRLLSLCAVAGVVIDEQSVYDPSLPDDKLLLDLKGTMSEADLHWLGLRLQGARRSKAERGELKLPVPT